MAPALGTQDPDLSASRGLSASVSAAGAVRATPWIFDFFQAMRILQRSVPADGRLATFTPPKREPLRLGIAPSLSFPASEMQTFEQPENARALLRVNFWGLVGQLGLLPVPYTELVLERARARDYTFRDFLDLFHHRLLSFFYRAWEKHNIAAELERCEEDEFSNHVYQLIGLGTPGLRHRMDIPDAALLYYGGLLAGTARSAAGLEQIISDYFDIPAEVEAFVGRWEEVEPSARCCFDEEDNGTSGPLGEGVLLGDEVWEQQSRFRVRLGPLPLERYREFLPGRTPLKELRSLVEFYTGPELEMVVQLVLKREETPGCELKAADTGVQLGWTTWLATRQMSRDPSETILEEAMLRLN